MKAAARDRVAVSILIGAVQMMSTFAARSLSTQALAGPLLVVAGVAAAVLLFAEGLEALGRAWMLPEYSHGPLIPILSGIMLLRQLRETPVHDGPFGDRWPGLVVIVLAVCVGVLGNAARIPDIVAYGVIIWVGGVLLVSFGWRTGRQLWPPVLHLAFMLPLPGLFYYKISTSLQFLSSEIGVALVQAAGVPAGLEGNVISLGDYRLHVAEACSGLRYLFPILSFSYIFAVLYRGPTWHKAVLLLSAAPIAVLMNAVRIGVIGVMVDLYGIEHAEGVSHFLEGWVVFLLCVALLFGLARVLLAMQSTPMGLADALDLDMSGLRAQAGRLRFARASGTMTVAVALTAAATLAWHLAPERSAPPSDREPLIFFPLELGAFSAGPPMKLSEDVRSVLGADDYRQIRFEADDGPPVELFIAWYADQTRGGIHSPEVCLPGSGWEMASIARIDVRDVVGAEAAFPVNRAVIQKGLDRLLVYYWFEQYGGRVAWDFAAKIALLRSGLEHSRTDGGLVRLVTPIMDAETEAQAEARLQKLLLPVTKNLSRFIPRA